MSIELVKKTRMILDKAVSDNKIKWYNLWQMIKIGDKKTKTFTITTPLDITLIDWTNEFNFAFWVLWNHPKSTENMFLNKIQREIQKYY